MLSKFLRILPTKSDHEKDKVIFVLLRDNHSGIQPIQLKISQNNNNLCGLVSEVYKIIPAKADNQQYNFIPIF